MFGSSAEKRRKKAARNAELYDIRSLPGRLWAQGDHRLGRYPGYADDSEEVRAYMLLHVRRLHGLDEKTGHPRNVAGIPR